MAEEDDSGEKPHDPTPRRLEEARRKGQIPRSHDLTAAGAWVGLLAAFVGFGSWSAERIGSLSAALIGQADRLAPLLLDGGGGPAGGVLGAAAAGAAPWLLLPAAGAALSVVAQRGFVVTAENLAPRLSRISPLQAARQKFGRAGLFEFAKSTLKLALVAAVLGLHLAREGEAILGMLHLPANLAAVETARLLGGFLAVVLALALVLGALDALWQRFEHLRRNRMSLKELRDEAKESEGDPHLRQERRRRGVDIATNRMLAEVPKADVVIVNPTHYAVALKWSRKKGAAPVCVAKGVDEIAARIRAAAAEAGVPIHRDPPTARALHATVDLGQEIRPEHYRAVAAAIRFAERMRARARTARRR
ncbi:MAG: EscU/YscU/HrcU family type III secretion system export apparatus switch protein [Rhodobacteraceae bacterium]|nr:EscU/YscU/HrcU family type III secretion system export apparatus switch protein [Paracoccaceae bacterium]